MLKVMRENIQSKFIKGLLWAVIISFIAGIFLIWGSGSQALEGNPNIVARVGGKDIYREEFEQRLRASGQETEDKQARMQMAGQILSTMIQEELWRIAAKDMGLEVTSKELFDKIMSYKDQGGNWIFKDSDGSYIGDERYKRIIESTYMTVSTFEANVRDELLMRKLADLLTSGIKVSDDEAREYFDIRNEKVRVKLATFETDTFTNQVVVNKADLEKYYNDNKETYRRPIMNKYEVVIIPISPYMEKVQIDNKDIREYYTENKDEFYEEEKRRAKHILFRLDPNADEKKEEEVKKTADNILKMAQEGIDFAELATRFSEDEATAANGGLLDYALRGAMQKPFDDAVFEMKVGDIRGPVKTVFGYHIIKLDDIKLPGFKQFEEVRDQIRQKLMLSRANNLRNADIENIQEKLEDSDKWESLSKELNLSYSMTEFIAPGAIPPGVPYSEELYNMTEEMEVGDMSPLIRGADNVAFIRLMEKRQSYIPPMDEVIADVERNYKTEQAKLMAEMKSNAAVNAINPETPFEDAMTINMGKISDPEPVNRLGTFQDLGNTPEIIKSAFAARAGEVKGPFEYYNGYAVIRIEEKIGIDFNQFLEEVDKIRNQIRNQKQQQALTTHLEMMYKKVKITTNNKLIEEMFE